LKSPNPEEASAFEYSLKLGKAVNADILIATDPDADRMGIAAKNDLGEYVLLTGNQTGAILLNYLAINVKHDENSYVYNTIVTSDIAAAICKKYHLTLVQTLTGFKYIGEQAALLENTNKKFFFGYEESYGCVVKPFVRDKDSFQATLLLCEVASYYKEQGKTLVNVLNDIYNEYGYYLEGVQNISLTGEAGAAKIKRIMNYFQNNEITTLGGKNIVRIEDYELQIAKENNKVSKITLPKASVMRYIYEGGGWVALRPSGTEPKLKIYIAIKETTAVKAQEFITKIKSDVMKLIDNIE
jgi:phosphoglucomutase